ncbi:hypothetical protein DB30_06734 [Enhygromyxa salina]|uniref:Uncharacterized protein n=1 Tax=Enhygromyxa salina TaxID=215803 RepID=A0A0C2D2Y6_9BACT|nr:hypothetical protein DB30_06734 [Enhygromyxa salina]
MSLDPPSQPNNDRAPVQTMPCARLLSVQRDIGPTTRGPADPPV